MTDKNITNFEHNMSELLTSLEDYRNLINSRGELYFNLQKLANTNVALREGIQHDRIQSEQEKIVSHKMENISMDLLHSFHDIFRDIKMVLLNKEGGEGESTINTELLIMTLDLISNISFSLKKKIVENVSLDGGDNGQGFDIITRLASLVNTIGNHLDVNQVDKYQKQIHDISDNASERIRYLETKLSEYYKKNHLLKKELDIKNRELECISLCQESGLLTNTKYEKIFSENIEATLFKGELQSLQKQYLEVKHFNLMLEEKQVNLMNEINSLKSKNSILEDKVKYHNDQNILNNFGATLPLTSKEQNRKVQSLTTANLKLNSILTNLRKDYKNCSKAYVKAINTILEVEIKNMKLENCSQNMKIANNQLELLISDLEKRIEGSDMELFRSKRKIEELFVQLAASETIRLSLEYYKRAEHNPSDTNTNALIYQVEIDDDCQETTTLNHEDLSSLEEIPSLEDMPELTSE